MFHEQETNSKKQSVKIFVSCHALCLKKIKLNEKLVVKLFKQENPEKGQVHCAVVGLTQ